MELTPIFFTVQRFVHHHHQILKETYFCIVIPTISSLQILPGKGVCAHFSLNTQDLSQLRTPSRKTCLNGTYTQDLSLLNTFTQELS